MKTCRISHTFDTQIDHYRLIDNGTDQVVFESNYADECYYWADENGYVIENSLRELN